VALGTMGIGSTGEVLVLSRYQRRRSPKSLPVSALKMKHKFAEAFAISLRRDRRQATTNFLRDFGERFVPGTSPHRPSIC